MTSLILSVFIAFATPLAPTVASPASITVGAAQEKVEFRLKNDTGSTVRLHTGRGTSSITNGSSNRYNVDVGQEFRLDSSSGDLLFEVSSDMDGETYELSDFM